MHNDRGEGMQAKDEISQKATLTQIRTDIRVLRAVKLRKIEITFRVRESEEEGATATRKKNLQLNSNYQPTSAHRRSNKSRIKLTRKKS